MTECNIFDIKNPVKDSLTDFLRSSAQKMLHMAIEAEVEDFTKLYRDERLEDGRQRIVRNGYLPQREIQTGIGSVEVNIPRVRDRSDKIEEKVIFQPSWIPKYMRRSTSLENLLPLLYLKGISTGDFKNVLSPLLGDEANNLSHSVICRLKKAWLDEYNLFQKKDLSLKKYVYWWVDGIYLEARMESEKRCVLVIIGVTENGTKELVSLVDGFRESKASWQEMLRDLKNRGLEDDPKLAIGDGALGFWGALAEEYPDTKWQRCWVHKTKNVLDKLPKSLQEIGKSDLREIYNSATKKDARKAFNYFIEKYKAKYPRATDCLQKDEEALLRFYEFPAEHWQSIRTTNPIESTFSTVRHRTVKSKGCFSRDTIMASVFKLIREAEKNWKKLYGQKMLADVINLVSIIDGVAAQKAAIISDQKLTA